MTPVSTSNVYINRIRQLRSQRNEAAGLIGELIDWFGAPDWTGPQLPVDLDQLATLLREATTP